MSGDHNMYASGSGDGQRSGWRKRQVLKMAEQASLSRQDWWKDDEALERFAEQVREDEAEKYKWDVHSCGPTCTKVACVAVREAVQAEREACAKVCDAADKSTHPTDLADAIRARGQA